MNKYLKEFLHRGLIFGGFGPLVAGIVYLIIGLTNKEVMVLPYDMFMAILSTYILAFLVSGASVFYQIEKLGFAKSSLLHFIVLYAAYTFCYLVNDWISFALTDYLIFTGIFIAGYLVIWLIVILSIKATEKKLNKKINN